MNENEHISLKLKEYRRMHDADYEQALKEIKNGHKESHWIWYIFPQIRGLGQSQMCKLYDIASLEEAKAFLNDEYLGGHLIEISNALLNLPTSNPTEVMGYPDDMKLCSCMTLFNIAAQGKIDVFKKVLDKFYHDIGGDAKTECILTDMSNGKNKI